MTASDPKSLKSIGFLTVVEHQETGLLGGYLVLNSAGRPLEFHCTTPVQANRAQQILYGPTLTPFLYGEQIGLTLLKKSKSNPSVVFTDRAPALAVRQLVEIPVVLVVIADKGSADEEIAQKNMAVEKTLRLDQRHKNIPAPSPAALLYFSLGEQAVAVDSSFENDRQFITAQWHEYYNGFDLAEPFGRLHQAIQEAQASSG